MTFYFGPNQKYEVAAFEKLVAKYFKFWKYVIFFNITTVCNHNSNHSA
jgi:hypothetical protein